MDSEKNGSFYQRILSWIQKIKCTFGKLCDKIKALSGKKEKLEEKLLNCRDKVHLNQDNVQQAQLRLEEATASFNRALVEFLSHFPDVR